MSPPEPAVRPEIPDLGAIDANQDKLDDATEIKLGAFQRAQVAGAPVVDELVRVEFVFSAQIRQEQLDAFVKLGGVVTHIYQAVSYGWNGLLPLSRLRAGIEAAGPTLVGVVEAQPIQVNLDIATRNSRVRPTVWNAGYDGSDNITIAIMDTGVDDSHPDLAGRMEYWNDLTGDNAATPEAFIAHGMHVASIAVGSGVSSGVNPTVIRYTDQGEFPETAGVSGKALHEIPDAVTQFDWVTNMVWETKLDAIARIGQSYSDGTSLHLVSALTGLHSPLTETNNDVTNPQVSAMNLYTSSPSGVINHSDLTYSAANTISADVSDFGVGDDYALFRGVAPGCRWAGFKVVLRVGFGSSDYVKAALDDVVVQRIAHNIKVVNMSVSLAAGGGEDLTWRSKANTAVNNGIVVCASAGNHGPTGEISDPGRASRVITVGATNDSNQLTDYTSRWIDTPAATEDYKPDILAPGGSSLFSQSKIMAADSNDSDGHVGSELGVTQLVDQVADDYLNIHGTSMAAPHVAGAAALIIEAMEDCAHSWDFYSSADARFVKMILLAGATETCQTRETGGYDPTLERASNNAQTGTNKDPYEGYGMINVDASIEALTEPFIDPVLGGKLGPGRTDRRAIGRFVDLIAGRSVTIGLTDMATGDYDLYLYDSDPDTNGNPIILASSTNPYVGMSEQIVFAPAETQRAYIFVKRVSGNGPFTLTCGLCGPQGIWVDFSHVGPETGSRWEPFNTFAEAYDAVPGCGEDLVIKAGSSSETPRIDKPMRIRSYGGSAILGMISQ